MVVLLSTKEKEKKRKVNRWLNITTHLFNVFIPRLMYLVVRLLFIIFYRYFEVLFKLLSRICIRYKNIYYSIIWTIIGPIHLTVLSIQDIMLFARVCLNCEDTPHEDIHSISLDEADRSYLLDIHTKIFKTAQKIVASHSNNKDNSGKCVVHMNRLLFDISINDKTLSIFENKAGMGHQEKTGEDRKTETKGEESRVYNMNRHVYDSKYMMKDQSRLYRLVLKKYIAHEDRVSNHNRNSMDINLVFMIEKMKHNLRLEKMHLLIPFDRANTERALKVSSVDAAVVYDESYKRDVHSIKHTLDGVTKDVQSIITYLHQIHS